MSRSKQKESAPVLHTSSMSDVSDGNGTRSLVAILPPGDDSDDDIDSPGGLGGSPVTESVPELREEMLHRLVRIARLEENRPRGRQTAVVAVKTYLELTEPKLRDAVIRMLGDEVKFEAWLRAELAALEARKIGG